MRQNSCVKSKYEYYLQEFVIEHSIRELWERHPPTQTHTHTHTYTYMHAYEYIVYIYLERERDPVYNLTQSLCNQPIKYIGISLIADRSDRAV
jgi:hypothetical protein